MTISLLLTSVLALAQNPGGGNSNAFGKYRFETGAFGGRIAKTQAGVTVAANTNNGIYYGIEKQMGGLWRLVLRAELKNYKTKSLGTREFVPAEFSYGDGMLGIALHTNTAEWRLLLVRAQVPYLLEPDTQSVQQLTALANMVRFEGILTARAPAFKLGFRAYIGHMLGQPAIGDGVMTNNYLAGGCANIFFGERFRWGPTICIDLHEVYLPESVTIFRQEVHARLQAEF